jgi:hypothetical protein
MNWSRFQRLVAAGLLFGAVALDTSIAHADVDFSPGVVKYSTKSTAGAVQGPALYIRNADFKALDQKNASDTTLYTSAAWANAPEDEEGTARKYWTCLATVYAMIEHARGNDDFRVGPKTYVDTAGGAQPIAGVKQENLKVDFNIIQAEIRAGNPVILQGSSASIPQGHFILAIGIEADGRIIALDPFGGKTIKIDPANWKSTNSSAPVTISKMRKVDF